MRLHVHEWGETSSPPLVCLHGVGAHGASFRRLAEERLAARFRVLAPDLRGHGRSPWEPPWGLATQLDDVLETLEGVGVKPSAWVGHSLGARLILELAAREPELVERAVLLDPAIRLRPDIALALAEEARRELRFPRPAEAVLPAFGGRRFHTPPERLDEERDEHLEAFGGGYRWRYCPSAVAALLGELASFAPPPEQLRAPILLVLGADESVVGPRQLARYERALADRLRVERVPGGHVVLWDAFEETADAAAEFLGTA
jgi:lipase